ncbi:hypothetical protein ACFLWX_03895 [Chloroflexota bacterium]
MKRVAIPILIALALVVGSVSAVYAAKPEKWPDGGKPQDVIERSNGFPSGMHFNLNIHGKDPAVYDCVETVGGNSIFVPIDGGATIEYVANVNRKNPLPDGSSAYELVVLDQCAVDGDTTAKVYLPTKVEVTDDLGNISLVPTDGFFVFGRILGKPNNGGDGAPSSMILSPNIVKQACNDADPDALNCDAALGLIVDDNVYGATEETFVRFDPLATKGKGKSKAVDITQLFLYTGWVYWGGNPETDGVPGLTAADIPVDWAVTYPEADLNGDATLELCEWVLYHPDINGDGVVGQLDASAAETWLPCAGIVLTDIDADIDGSISLEEWQAFQATLNHATYFENRWVFDIADLVVTHQGIENDGAKLVQIRFYPRATTNFSHEYTYN